MTVHELRDKLGKITNQNAEVTAVMLTNYQRDERSWWLEIDYGRHMILIDKSREDIIE